MAIRSLLALLDDITAVLDDVAAMTKVAAKKSTGVLDDVASMTKVATKKTAGVLGDDLALNAKQVSGVNADRELPVIWAVAKGSFINKLILIPAALLISVFAPWLITPLLMFGGAFLCFEGAEKLIHKLFHKNDPHTEKTSAEPETVDEKEKIKGAIRTDFILSAEIIVIALGSIDSHHTIGIQLAVLSAIGMIMTVGVYGLVAGIVKIDDFGLFLMKKNPESSLLYKKGQLLINTMPYLMRFLTVVGTAAMFMVGGGILVHGMPFLHHLVTQISALPVSWLFESLFNGICGVLAGVILAVIFTLLMKLKPVSTKPVK